MISEKIREDFPVLQNNKGLIYFDSAATSLKPIQVIEATNNYYKNLGANVHRGNHHLSQQATQLYEESRKEAAKFIKAKEEELVFTRNATESINAIATGLERQNYFSEGDEIVISALEHHANIVPWQELCKRTGSVLKIAELNEDFTLNMQDLQEKVSGKTKLVSVAHASNTVATIFPVKEIGKIAHENNALFLIDAAQSVPHFEVNAKKINADFLVISSHKMLGPTGVGCLYGKKDLLEEMPPYNYGGSMISKVTYENTEWASLPEKFEAGTMPIAEVIGFGEAVRYLKKLGMENVHEHEKKLLNHCIEKMKEIDRVKMYCPQDAENQGGIVLFGVKGIDAVDLGVALDESKNIATRSGMHCAEPIVSSLNPKGLGRASFYLYNTIEEIDTFVDEVTAISKAFK
ncbi:MAG: cysteine desulfurase [Candidatus Diapherotrites archaeon]|uniref:cysteine desulfurase n=1 Tax=Candidatus Iainarchaeum sp. TaxID=3101447 RepID=A0A2D6LQB1_9ARCH|nr:cysteine desulfurase [Candidatus Diapherotrites archaeon]|tara:strand:+ start:10382 stop:11596 length:1215 start_codon:yes stop_codon:yes gene_type:complete